MDDEVGDDTTAVTLVETGVETVAGEGDFSKIGGASMVVDCTRAHSSPDIGMDSVPFAASVTDVPLAALLSTAVDAEIAALCS